MSEDPRPGTTAAVERRVERMAEEIGGIDKRLALVELEQRHARELQKQGFDAINANLTAVGAEVRALSASQAAATAEAKVRESKSISNARLLAMVASTATVCGVVFGIVVSILR